MPRRAAAMFLFSLAVVVAGLIYTAFLLRTGLEQDLALWAGQQRQRGWTVAARLAPPVRELLISGIDLRDVSIAGGDDLVRGGFRVAADRVGLRAELLHPQIVHVTLEGDVTLGFAALPRLRFTADRLVGTVMLRNGGKIASIAIDGKNLHSADWGGVSVGTLDATLAFDDRGAELGLRTEALVVPADPYGLGQHVSDLTLNAALVGWPPDAGSAGARADIWRAGGGGIEISKLMAGWGPLGLVGQAHIGLDQALQPDGSAKLQVRGYQAVLDGLGNNGAAIAAMIAASQPGDAAEFDLRIKKNAVMVDRIKLVKIPRIVW